jgi:protein ImuA
VEVRECLEQNMNNSRGFAMGSALPQPTLQHLRQALAGIDPSLGPCLPEPGQIIGTGVPDIDAALGGGLLRGALHEFSPTAPMHLAAATGFAMALTARACGTKGQLLWIVTEFALMEGGGPYGPGLDLFGLPSARLLVLRVPRAVDALWAMEEALRCRALDSVIAELADDAPADDLTTTRRLMLAARQGGCPGFFLRYRATDAPSAAATRWQVAAAPSRSDIYGGLGRARFDLSLRKNRRGSCGRWFIEWDHHERAFQPKISVAMAPPALDRPDRAPAARAG